MTKFCASTSEEFFTEEYESREDAIKNYPREDVLAEGETFFVGEMVPFVPRVNGLAVLEALQEQALEDCGENAENFLDEVSKDDMVLLGQRLDEVIKQWLFETKNEPHFFGVKHITEHVYEPQDEKNNG